MVGISRKNPKRIKQPQKYNNEKSLAYITTHDKNNPELYTEILKNLEEIENKDKIKEILDTTKIIKSQRQTKIWKEFSSLLHSEKYNTRSYQMEK